MYAKLANDKKKDIVLSMFRTKQMMKKEPKIDPKVYVKPHKSTLQ